MHMTYVCTNKYAYVFEYAQMLCVIWNSVCVVMIVLSQIIFVQMPNSVVSVFV